MHASGCVKVTGKLAGASSLSSVWVQGQTQGRLGIDVFTGCAIFSLAQEDILPLTMKDLFLRQMTTVLVLVSAP